VKDLTAQATGISLIVLLVAYVATQMGTQVIMAQPTMDQNTRRLMMFLPLIFLAFVYRFPAGVLVYWVTTNTWMLLQQGVFKYRIRRLQPPTPAGPTALVGANGKGNTDIDYAALGNGAGASPSGGLRGLLPRPKPPVAPVKAPARTGGPPPSARKKKKRSGRRR
jgi:YidC/Oxa1 family membrane protein insertase